MTHSSDRRWLPWLLIAALVILAAVAYLPSFQGQFVFDDLLHIVHNRSIQSFSALAPKLASCNRPVIFLTLWLNYRIGGLNVLGYHVLNFAVHLIAGLTLFGLVRRTLKMPPLDARFAGPRAELLAFVVALLWLVHPLQTQAVTYIIQRCESMMGMCYLLALYCLLRGSQSARRWPWYAGCITAGWLGMGCKEVMITAPLVMLLFDRVFLAPSWADVLRRRWGLYLAFLPPAIWLLGVTFRAPAEVPDKSVLASDPASLEYLSSQPAIILHYLRLAVLPDRLCFDYKWPVQQEWWAVLLPGLGVLVLFLASLAALWYRPRLGFVAFSFFVVLAPTSSIQPIADLAVEHRMYLPLALFLVLAVLGFCWIIRGVVAQRRHRAAIYAATALIVAGAWTTRTFVRNHVYTKPAALWTNALAHAPHNARAYNNFACYLTAAGEFEAAAGQFRRAIELDDQFDIAYCNLARVLDKLGRTDEGIELLRKGIEIIPPKSLLHCDLAVLLEKQGDEAEAVAQYRRALELYPEYGRAHYKLGAMLSRQGKLEEAIAHFLVAIEQRPKDVGCNFRLALACQRLGDFTRAIEYYQRTLEASPQFDKARRNLELCRKGSRDGEPPSDELEEKKKVKPGGEEGMQVVTVASRGVPGARAAGAH